MAMCDYIKPGILYVGSEPTGLRRSSWMQDHFSHAGSRYYKWFQTASNSYSILNVGIIGGYRGVVGEYLDIMSAVLLDEPPNARPGSVFTDMARSTRPCSSNNKTVASSQEIACYIGNLLASLLTSDELAIVREVPVDAPLPAWWCALAVFRVLMVGACVLAVLV